MLKIRLMKPGKSVKGRYHYKVVVIEAGKPRDSRFKEQLGYYDPSKNIFKIDLEKFEGWKKKGARPSETVAALAKRHKKTLAKNNA